MRVFRFKCTILRNLTFAAGIGVEIEDWNGEPGPNPIGLGGQNDSEPPTFTVSDEEIRNMNPLFEALKFLSP